jgi:outer membrane protein assembly factor BamB
MSLRRFAAYASVALFPLGFAGAEDWARLRGPNGTGVVAEATPVKFTAKDQLWKTAIPGVGHGSPIVVGERVFIQSSSADSKTRSLYCLGAKSGTIEWTKSVGGQKADSIHKKNTPASSTPASDGTNVYASVWDGSAITLFAYDLMGKELWNTPLGTFSGAHGAGHSPMVYDGVVYLNIDSDSSAKLVALDAKTGAEKWKADRLKERASYTTPMILEAKGKPAQVLLGTSTTVDSYDPKTGKVNWTFAVGTKLRAVGQPILAAGNLVTYMGEGGKGRHMVSVKTDGSGDVTETGKAWELNDASKTPYVPSALAHGDHIYWVNDTGFAGCIEAKTGKIVWYERCCSKGVSSSPILVKDVVLVFDEDGKAVAFRASPKGFEKLGESALGEAVLSSPAAAGGRLYVRGAEHLFCFGPKGS